LFVLTLAVVVHAAARGWWRAAALTLVFDVLINACPVMLQRYNRARLRARFGSTLAGWGAGTVGPDVLISPGHPGELANGSGLTTTTGGS
jgi:Glycosyl-4,4'-diaponeurosporenoate acyltransferase